MSNTSNGGTSLQVSEPHVYSDWMPDFLAPWKRGAVREEYAAGFWSYALGRPAAKHKRYAEACRLAQTAKKARRFSPWWIRTVADVDAVLQGCWFDAAAGQYACDFLEELTLSKGEWAGQKLELSDWQRYDWIMPQYGWKSADGLRRFTQSGVWIPKKNGKSGLASGLGLYHLRADREPAAYVWIASIDKVQAKIIYNESKRMVEATPWLTRDIRIVKSSREIHFDRKHSELHGLSADVKQKEGLDWSAGIYDELHVAPREMWSVLEGGGAARQQPLMISISTAGIYDALSIGWEQWEYARQVREGELYDPSFFALQYYGQEEEWDDWNNVLRANPNAGITCKVRYLTERLKKAQQSEAKRSDYLRYHLNVWVNAAVRWMPAATWATCEADADYTADLLGKPCYGGLDLSLTRDLTSLCLAFPGDEEDDPIRFLWYYWLPKENIRELEAISHAPYQRWAGQGYIELTEGDVIDYHVVRDQIIALGEMYEIEEIGCDKHLAPGIMRDLDDAGFTMLEIPQGMMSMSPITSAFEVDICQEKVKHLGNPITNWMVGNCQAKYDHVGNYMLQKGDGKVRYKIDGVVAAVMAHSRAKLSEGAGVSIYVG